MSIETTAPVTKKLEVKEATELAEFYHVPKSLMNMMFIVFGDTAYPKEHFLLFLGHQKGIQRIEVDEPKKENEEYHTEARIYPRVDAKMIEAISKLPERERKEAWEYLTKPTVEWGRASPRNVKMTQMHEWLDAIAIKRAVCRALRLFIGVGVTSYEEIPEVVITKSEVKNARSITATAGGRPPSEEEGQAKLISS